MILGTMLGSSYGALAGAWRAPGIDPGNFTSTDAQVRISRTAERGGFAFMFLPDFAAVRGGEEHAGLSMTMDPMLALAAVARETSKVGLVATGSTTFQEPYNLARQYKALDVMSHGRAGWNAVTTSDPAVAANYGRPVADRSERYHAPTRRSSSSRPSGAAGEGTPGSGIRPPGATSTRRRSGRSTCGAITWRPEVRCRSRRPSRASR